MSRIAQLVHRSQTVMVPIKNLKFTYNLVRPKDPEEEVRIETDILKRGLEKPLDGMKGQHLHEVEVLNGELRTRIIERAHKNHKAVRFLGTGQIIPVDKIPVIGSERRLSETEAWFASVRYNTEQSMIHPEVMQLALGAHFTKMMQNVKHGDKAKVEEHIADEFNRTVRWVQLTIQRWEGLSSENKKAFLGPSAKTPKIKMTHLLYASKVKNKSLQSVAIHRIEKRHMGEQKALAYTRALGAATDQVEPASVKEAEGISNGVEHQLEQQAKKPRSQAGMENVSDKAFMRDAAITVESVSCPYGKRKISHVPCLRMACPSCGKPIFESVSEPPECDGCGDKGKDLKLSACSARVKIYAPPQSLQAGIMKEAKRTETNPITK